MTQAREKIKVLNHYVRRIEILQEKVEDCDEVLYLGTQVPYFSLMEKRNEQVNLCLRFIRKYCGTEIEYVRIHQHNVSSAVASIRTVVAELQRLEMEGESKEKAN